MLPKSSSCFRVLRLTLSLTSIVVIPVAVFAGVRFRIPTHVSTAGIATSLKPPVTINGSSQYDLLNITNSSTTDGGALYATSAGPNSTLSLTSTSTTGGVIYGTSEGTNPTSTFFNTGSSSAVYAQSAAGDGIDVSSSGGNGVTATTSGTDRNAIAGSTSGANSSALYGMASQGLALLLKSAGDSYGNVMYVSDLNNNALMLLDKNGNLTIRGKLTTKSTFDRPGSATLVHGDARIDFSADTKAGIAGRRYAVFLTPLGDGPSLYVAQKTPTGFEVRESAGGRTSMGFDFRVMTL